MLAIEKDQLEKARSLLRGGISADPTMANGHVALRVAALQTAFGSPRAYSSGGPPAMEGGLTNPTGSHRYWTTDGGQVNPPQFFSDRLNTGGTHDPGD